MSYESDDLHDDDPVRYPFAELPPDEIRRRAHAILLERIPAPFREPDEYACGTELWAIRESRAELAMPIVAITDRYLARPSPGLAAVLRRIVRSE